MGPHGIAPIEDRTIPRHKSVRNPPSATGQTHTCLIVLDETYGQLGGN